MADLQPVLTHPTADLLGPPPLGIPPIETPTALPLENGSDPSGRRLLFPIELHERVVQQLEFYADGAGRSTIEAGLARIGLYLPMVTRIFAEEGIPLDLIHLAQAESTFKPEAVSKSMARGMWQFIASSGDEYGLRRNEWIDERSDPEKSTRAAARYLRRLYDQFGDWYLAMAAYNSGGSRVSDAMAESGASDFWGLAERSVLPAETLDYVPTILAMTLIGHDPERYGFDIPDTEALNVERVQVDQATDLRVIADRLELPIDQIQMLNPHVLHWVTPPGDGQFELTLPSGYAQRFLERVAPLAESERLLFRYHVVSSGETLSYLAQRYEVSIGAITRANQLTDAHLIRIGQSLLIPMSGIVNHQMSAFPMTGAEIADPAPEVYQIRVGDTLYGIAERFGLSIEQIEAWNPASTELLIPGETLRLAASITTPQTTDPSVEALVYRVRPGDTLSRIAGSYQTSVAAIQEWNPHADLSIIHPGDPITIYLQRRSLR